MKGGCIWRFDCIEYIMHYVSIYRVKFIVLLCKGQGSFLCSLSTITMTDEKQWTLPVFLCSRFLCSFFSPAFRMVNFLV